MTEIFYGPWRLIVRQADPFPKFGFRVSGSGNANGIYEADSSHPGILWSRAPNGQ